MKYFKISIKEGDQIKKAVTTAETVEEVEEVCKKNNLQNYEISEIEQKEFVEIKKKTPETKEEAVKKAEEKHEEAQKINLEEYKGKKIIPFEGCPYRIEEKYQNATKQNILLVADSLNPFGFKDAKSAAKYLLSIGFEIK